MENEVLVSPSLQCSSTPVGFGQGFRSKEQCDITEASPTLYWPGCSWLLPGTSTEINFNGMAFFVVLLIPLRNRQTTWKGFHKVAYWIFPKPWQSLAEVYICKRELFWMKCRLNYCTFCASQKGRDCGNILKLQRIQSGTASDNPHKRSGRLQNEQSYYPWC